MKVVKFISPYRNTNNYLIEISPKIFVGVDIGHKVISNIVNFLNKNDATLVAYFITHAHADHSIGIKGIYDYFNIPIYCSKECAVEINDARTNFSIYTDEIPTYAYDLPFSILTDESEVDIHGKIFKAYHIPGHSPGCMVFDFGSMLFTGDFLMNNYKTPLNFPNSSQFNYNRSLAKMSHRFSNKTKICYSGHGETFFINDRLQQLLLPNTCI